MLTQTGPALSLLLLLTVPVAMGQTRTASIQGTVLDVKTQKPVPAALVNASRTGAPPFTRSTKSDGDGAFQIEGLIDGNYSLCVQAANDQYVNPCQWNSTPTGVKLVSGQAAAGIKIALTPASVVNIQVRDAQKALSQLTRDGRSPDLSLGVWGPRGLYYPAHRAGSPAHAANLPGGVAAYSYRLAVPRDAALTLDIASRDVKLGDANGVALPANASQQAFQHATGDANPKSFTFSVLGLLPRVPHHAADRITNSCGNQPEDGCDLSENRASCDTAPDEEILAKRFDFVPFHVCRGGISSNHANPQGRSIRAGTAPTAAVVQVTVVPTSRSLAHAGGLWADRDKSKLRGK